MHRAVLFAATAFCLALLAGCSAGDGSQETDQDAARGWTLPEDCAGLAQQAPALGDAVAGLDPLIDQFNDPAEFSLPADEQELIGQDMESLPGLVCSWQGGEVASLVVEVFPDEPFWSEHRFDPEGAGDGTEVTGLGEEALHRERNGMHSMVSRSGRTLVFATTYELGLGRAELTALHTDILAAE
ncbi:hypothetical protein [Nocardiopsis ansamitocini]|uniref:DUF3558 domain-containing protein n=1 Tax=Nocardiopsis ansamitocini TaxID=1670832 RepID=A0A9W6P7Z6_9ACTN|nr:hypothetical protein [Nocardiopsis ansamitocini]GLU48855.1 hypothetical protein Nans01_32060 [Nocardiopsis ansamitocini]